MSDKDLAFRQKLFDKSVEAFLLAVETYNKPTIKYRVNDNVPVPLRQTSEDEENQKLTRLEIKA